MSGITKIEWADKVWNPVTGCTKVSDGCRNCYAERMAERFWKDRQFSDVQCHADRLKQPLSWKKPARVFVNSMSDLFHLDVDKDFIGDVFRNMEKTPQHTFIILTKRPKEMLYWFNLMNAERYLPNVWLGVSVENQQTADERIPLLLKTPAAVRFVSCEPLLGPVDLSNNHPEYLWGQDSRDGETDQDPLDWVICGGESGPNARPMHPDWARSLRDQCQAAGVPFFFKQNGEWDALEKHPETSGYENVGFFDLDSRFCYPGVSSHGQHMVRVGKKKAGRLLDGVEWNAFPVT